MLKVKNLRHQYKGSDKKIVFPDFHCDTGGHILCLGPSGSGKSSLLHILSGILKASEGEVWVDDTNIHDQKANELSEFRKKNIGIIFQRHHFIQSLNVFENLKYTQYFTEMKEDHDELYELLELLDLAEIANKKVYQISEGQKQRLSIARSMVNHPKIILADEPSSSLDDINCDLLVELLKKSQMKYNSSLVIVSHDQRLIPHFTNRIEMQKL